MFNDQWEVVALHHSGVPNRDAQGNLLDLDGHIWDASMGEQRIAWKANEGVRISEIVAHIKAQPLNEAQQAIRAGLFPHATAT